MSVAGRDHRAGSFFPGDRSPTLTPSGPDGSHPALPSNNPAPRSLSGIEARSRAPREPRGSRPRLTARVFHQDRSMDWADAVSPGPPPRGRVGHEVAQTRSV